MPESNEPCTSAEVSVEEMRRLRFKAVKLIYEHGAGADVQNLEERADRIVNYVTNGKPKE